METIALTRELSERFWAKVDKSGECWTWTAARNERGYGTFGVPTSDKWKALKAHRVAFMLSNGEIPDGLLVDHACRNRSCVNPGHLRLATVKQNQENLTYATKPSTSGVRGVSWASRHNKWLAKVTHNRCQVYVGLFDDVAEAEAAVIAKRNTLFTHNEVDRGA